MIVADRKKMREIRDLIRKHDRVLLVGCGTCVTVCLAGGEREVGILGSALRMSLRLAGRGACGSTSAPSSASAKTPSSTSWPPACPSTTPSVRLGCGAGVQALAERFPKTPVYPGLNTQFIGILESQGVWTEKCAGCGNCRLGEFAGICPITRCAKRLFNGPCGGSQDGKCEVNPDLECGWQLIYDRAASLGIADSLERIGPRTTGPPAWTAARAKWSARTSASPGSCRKPDAAAGPPC